MKKYLAVVFVAVFALVLTGCGKGETLKCTFEEDGAKGTVTVSFKNDKVSKVVTSGEYETKEEAEQAYGLMSLAAAFGGEDAGIKTSLKGKTVTITMTGKALEEDDMNSYSKKEIKEKFEDQGYDCK